MRISFVIPAFNEAAILRSCLECIQRFTPEGFSAEVIVVDNHSTDDTVRVARECGASQVISTGGTVAAVRNVGARCATGEALVFLDADVLLTASWRDTFAAAARSLVDQPQQITGSWVSVPERPTYIERNWFAPQQDGVKSHMNSGHMILLRARFESLGGFDEGLATGEDYELSRRAADRGYSIVNRPELRVLHEGYPKTLWAFARREYWHGLGYYSSWAAFFRSPVTWLAQLLFLSLLVAGVAAVISGKVMPLLLWLSGSTLVLGGLSARLFRKGGFLLVLRNVPLYFTYMLARFLSLFGAAGILPTRISRSALAAP